MGKNLDQGCQVFFVPVFFPMDTINIRIHNTDNYHPTHVTWTKLSGHTAFVQEPSNIPADIQPAVEADAVRQVS